MRETREQRTETDSSCSASSIGQCGFFYPWSIKNTAIFRSVHVSLVYFVSYSVGLDRPSSLLLDKKELIVMSESKQNTSPRKNRG
jgi:hypothetical protein